jgi:hypothetical protein
MRAFSSTASQLMPLPQDNASLLCSDMYSQSGPLDKSLSTITVQALEWSTLVSFALT